MLLVSFPVLSGFSTPVIADLDKDDRAAINKVIEQYIKNNPEVLRDALLALTRRERTGPYIGGTGKVRVDDGDPVMGNLNGSLVVYEFSDYNCGYCKECFLPFRKY